MTNESVRERLKSYMANEPVAYVKIGSFIGLDENQRKYVLNRFAKGKDLYPETMKRLSDFLKSRGY